MRAVGLVDRLSMRISALTVIYSRRPLLQYGMTHFLDPWMGIGQLHLNGSLGLRFISGWL